MRPSERGKGYAKEMLCLNIQNAKVMGIDKLLVTCDVRNEASEKTILANGGVYEKMIDVSVAFEEVSRSDWGEKVYKKEIKDNEAVYLKPDYEYE